METETYLPTQEHKSAPSNLKARLAGALLFMIPFVVMLLTIPSANEQKNNGEEIVRIKKTFPEVNILAKSAYVWDVENQRVIYAKNEKEPLPLASLTKVMTALVAWESRGDYDKIKITSDSIRQEGDSGLANEEKWKLKDLIDFSLITSSNDGIYAVASAIESRRSSSTTMNMTGDQENESDTKSARENFIDLMNKKAKDISLNQTFYLNETGLDSSDNVSGGYGSAEDMAKLFAYTIKNNPEILEATAYDAIKLVSLDDIDHKAKNTNEITGEIPSLIASKTGYTDISGGNLIVAFDLGLMRPIIISVLGSTIEGRFDDMKKLIGAAVGYLTE